jgi:hypothetical protein
MFNILLYDFLLLCFFFFNILLLCFKFLTFKYDYFYIVNKFNYILLFLSS